MPGRSPLDGLSSAIVPYPQTKVDTQARHTEASIHKRRVECCHMLQPQNPALFPIASSPPWYMIHRLGLFKKYILLIMLLELSQFFSLYPLHPVYPIPSSTSPHLSSCLWVVHISSLATQLPILFLTSPYPVPTNLYFLIPALSPHSPSHW